jgi:pseudomonalisin
VERGGGGLSQFELGGYWQSPLNPASTVGRGVPDVALDADPTSGVYLWLDGAETCCYGGTSLSSPMALGVWARFESAHGNKLGFANPTLSRSNALAQRGFTGGLSRHHSRRQWTVLRAAGV